MTPPRPRDRPNLESGTLLCPDPKETIVNPRSQVSPKHQPTARDVGGSHRTWVTIGHAAAHLGVSTKTLRRMVAAGHVPMYRFGSRLVRFDLAEIDAVARRVPTAGGDLR